ncbi:unnamed protein product [Coregonus sp. 'balchen']|nr:unnamed protein product [Coregonus sp. 'balchen']
MLTHRLRCLPASHVLSTGTVESRKLAKVKGLFALLLMLLEWTRPGLPSPMRPICDLRVLKHFIEEARDAQAAMALEQAQEVQSGLWLLNQAISSLRASVTNTALQSHIDNSLINIFRIGKVLRSLNIQVHVNFLRGKVQLLLSNAPVCYQGGS